MTRALIGYTGFVGGNLLRQQQFDACYNRSNIDQIEGKEFDELICAGVPATKWIANSNPEEDKENINALIENLSKVKVGRLILVSTVDVYPRPIDVDEDDEIDIESSQPYGKHRYELEQCISASFNSLIIRLPGLFGTGLKKNVIYDFLNGNDVYKVDSRGSFQFYYLDHLTTDIEKARNTDIRCLNITSEPMTVAEVASICLGREFLNELDVPPASYDYRTRYSELYGGHDGYMYSKQQVLSDLEHYVHSVRGVGS